MTMHNMISCIKGVGIPWQKAADCIRSRTKKKLNDKKHILRCIRRFGSVRNDICDINNYMLLDQHNHIAKAGRKSRRGKRKTTEIEVFHYPSRRQMRYNYFYSLVVKTRAHLMKVFIVKLNTVNDVLRL